MVHEQMQGYDGTLPGSPGERRVGTRALVDRPVDLFVDGFRHRCRVVNASVSGMLVHLTKALAQREPHLLTECEIDAGSGRRVHVMTRTVWRRDAMKAVLFVGLGPVAREEIADMVSRVLRPASTEVDRLDAAEREDQIARRRRIGLVA
jgi:hypothetical protein